MIRREFITPLGGAATWPLAARAQQGDRVRRIGVLLVGDENDPFTKLRLSAFMRALADAGWTEGRNVRTDIRSAGNDTNRLRALAQELVKSMSDVNAKLDEASFYIERSRTLVKSIASFPYITKSY